MSNSQDLNSETTENLLEYIQWKDEPDYTETAKEAFRVFTFRFQLDLQRKLIPICKNWGYDEQVASEIDFGLTGKEIDPDKIINGTFKEKKIIEMPNDIKKEEINPYRMAARNGNELPKHIMDKIKKNQSKSKNDSSESEETNK